MSNQTQISFTVPTTNTDGSAITEPLSYSALIDTVNPPVKAYAVPAAQVAAAVGGVVTATFAQLGFTPVKNTDYFVDVIATDAEGSSAPSAMVAFAYSVVPNAPTGLKVS
jgi:hypothetical protein